MTPPDAAAETGERRIIADGIRSYEDLLNAFRLRIREQGLAISAEANTEIAGLSDRYLQKIVGSRPVKRIGAIFRAYSRATRRPVGHGRG